MFKDVIMIYIVIYFVSGTGFARKVVWLCKVIQQISNWLQSYKHGRETVGIERQVIMGYHELVLCFKWLASSTAFVFESVLDGLTSFFYYIKDVSFIFL